MEKFRRTIQKRIWMYIGVIAIFSFMLGAQAFGWFTPAVANEHYVDFLSGFQFGILVAVDLVCVYNVFYYLTALKDNEKLKKLYIKENDERELEIDKRSGMVSYKAMIIILIIAAVIVGYFSMEGFIALMGAALLEIIVRVVLYGYYSKTI